MVRKVVWAAAGFLIVIVLIFVFGNKPKDRQDTFQTDISHINKADSHQDIATDPPVANADLPSTTALTPKVTAGNDTVKNIMAELKTLGCKNTLHEPVGVTGTTVWSPQFVEDNTDCLVLISAGTPEQSFTVFVKKPSGDEVKSKSPTSIVKYFFCADSPGVHSISVTCQTDCDYTFAAMDCPLDIAKKLMN